MDTGLRAIYSPREKRTKVHVKFINRILKKKKTNWIKIRFLSDVTEGKANMTNQSSDTPNKDFLKELSARDFLKIGMDEIAYVKRISVRGLDDHAFAIHAADGTQLSVLNSMDMAVATLEHNDLMCVTVH